LTPKIPLVILLASHPTVLPTIESLMAWRI
jgi:hypothetical protein